MPTYRVPVTCRNTIVYLIEARNAEEAMNKALDGNELFEIESDTDGDEEVYFPDITKIKD